MSVNTMTFQQCANTLSSLVYQASGLAARPVNTEFDFVSVGQTALNLGRDVIYNALSNVLAKTIFAIRPYSASMTGLEKSLPQWGAYMRKFNIVMSDWNEDKAYQWPAAFDASQDMPSGNGMSIDPWVIQKRNFVQTNFLGQSVFSDHYTIFEDQLETAFQSSEEFGQFLSMMTTDMSNRIEFAKENLSRGLVGNMILGLYYLATHEEETGRVIHLLSQYNTLTGQNYTYETIHQPENYVPFMRWVYSEVATIASRMREMSLLYQTLIDDKPVFRHTPYNKQKFYMLAQDRYQIDSRVLADTFHDNYLRYADVETVNFWQNINMPDELTGFPYLTNVEGEVIKGIGDSPTTPVSVGKVFGLLFDEDAMGWSMIHNRVVPTTVNGSGLYRNIWYHMRLRCFSDNTEKAVLFLMD